MIPCADSSRSRICIRVPVTIAVSLALAGLCGLFSERATAQSHPASPPGVALAPWTGPVSGGTTTRLPAFLAGGVAAAPPPKSGTASSTSRKTAPLPPAGSRKAAPTAAQKSSSAPARSDRKQDNRLAAGAPPSQTIRPTKGQKSQSDAGGRPAAPAAETAHPPQAKPSRSNPDSPARALNAGAPNPLSEARPDTENPTAAIGSSQLQESPASALGGAWKMLVYLIPLLLLMLGCLHLLRRFQQKTGRISPVFASALPSGRPATSRSLGGLLSAFTLSRAPLPSNGSLRVIETLPLGAAQLHLIEVRGRMLLVSASGTQVTLLSAIETENEGEVNGFRSLLHAAAHDIDALALSGEELPATAAVSAIEDAMQQTGRSMQRRLLRLRTVSEEEALYERE